MNMLAPQGAIEGTYDIVVFNDFLFVVRSRRVTPSLCKSHYPPAYSAMGNSHQVIHAASQKVKQAVRQRARPVGCPSYLVSRIYLFCPAAFAKNSLARRPISSGATSSICIASPH